MTIRKLIYMILSWLAILSLAGALFMLVMLNFNQANGRVVNYSGIVRGGAQRIAKIHLLGEPVEDIVASLEKTMNGLIDGDKSLGLPKASDPAFRQKMEAVRQKRCCLRWKKRGYSQKKLPTSMHMARAHITMICSRRMQLKVHLVRRQKMSSLILQNQ